MLPGVINGRRASSSSLVFSWTTAVSTAMRPLPRHTQGAIVVAAAAAPTLDAACRSASLCPADEHLNRRLRNPAIAEAASRATWSLTGCARLVEDGMFERVPYRTDGELAGGRDVAWGLVAGDLAVAVPAQGVGVDGGAVCGADPGHDLFAVALVRHADHLDVGDVGMGVEELLDLTGIDVLAAADDHVLDPPDDIDVAVVGHHCLVAGVHPARAVDRVGGPFGVFPVAEHHAVAAGLELSGRAARQCAAGVGVGDADLYVRVHVPDCGGAVLEVVLCSSLGRDRGCLGHSVADRDLAHVHPVDHLAHYLDRARRPGHDARP